MNGENRRILVTGGAGFIGTTLVRDLVADGASVRMLDDFTNGNRSSLPSDVEVVEASVDSDACAEHIATFEPETIIHLAARHYIPYCEDQPVETFQTNVMGTRTVYDAASTLAEPPTVVFASSGAVYPPSDTAHAESQRAGPMDIYGRTKTVAEDLTELYARREGVPATSLRLFNVYGPGETNDHLIPAILRQLGDGGDTVELGNLSPARDFVHVSDVSRAFRQALVGTDCGYHVYNVGTGIEHTVKEVAEIVADAFGDRIDIREDEERKRESDRPHLRADVSRIEAELGWTPQVSFEEGIGDLVTETVDE